MNTQAPKFPFLAYAASLHGSGYKRAKTMEDAVKKANSWRQSDFGSKIVRRWVTDTKNNTLWEQQS